MVDPGENLLRKVPEVGLGPLRQERGRARSVRSRGLSFLGEGSDASPLCPPLFRAHFHTFFVFFFAFWGFFFFFNVKFKHSTHWTEGEDQLRWQMIDVLGRGRTGLWRKRWRAALWPGQASPRLAALVYRRGDTWPGALSGAVGGYIQTSGHG